MFIGDTKKCVQMSVDGCRMNVDEWDVEGVQDS
jgi:hypothetical protein